MKIYLRKYKGNSYLADNTGFILVRHLTQEQIKDFNIYLNVGNPLFCNDCGNKFKTCLRFGDNFPGFTYLKSLKYGVYYKRNSKPICYKCGEKRYRLKVVEYEKHQNKT